MKGKNINEFFRSYLGYFSSKKDTDSLNHNGKLQLPEEAELVFLEPGIRAEIKIENAETFKKDAQEYYSVGQGLLKKGQKVLARPVPDSDFLEIVLYEADQENLNPNLPESGRGVKITKDEYGSPIMFFIDKKNLTYTLDYNQQSNEFLFKNTKKSGMKTNISDFNQTVLADCFLLSSMMSILNASGGIEFFEKIMCQLESKNKDHEQVVVKLHNPESGIPIYVQVMKSFYCEGKNDTILHDKFWIHIMEKAYAGLGYTGEKGSDKYLFGAYTTIYGIGGKSSNAFKILTGSDAEYVSLPQPDEILKSTRIWKISRISNGLNHYQLLDLEIKNIERIMEQSDDEKTINECKEKLKLYGEQLEKVKNNNSELLDCFGSMENIKLWNKFINYLMSDKSNEVLYLSTCIKNMNKEEGDIYGKDILVLSKLLENFYKTQCKKDGNYEDFLDVILLAIKHLDKLNDILSEETITSSFLKDNKIYEFSERGRYTKEQLMTFNNMCKNFSENRMMTASTPSSYSDKVLGLRPNHCYAILDCIIKKLPQKEPVCYIRIRNPWGRVGVNYNLSDSGSLKDMVENKDLAEFDIELTDFFKYFSGYTVCAPVVGLSLQDTRGCYLYTGVKESLGHEKKLDNL